MRLLSQKRMVTRPENAAWQRSGEKGSQSARRVRALVVSYDSWTIISKGQLIAPLRHTASQSVHQLHFTVSTTVMTLLTTARALQWHTLTHNPQPSHF